MDSLVRVDKATFFNYSDEQIIQKIFPEDFWAIRGKDYEYKKRVVGDLNKGQRPVFVFIAVYFHNVAGWGLFFKAFEYEITRGFFNSLEESLAYLNDQKLLSIIRRGRKIYFNKDDSLKKKAYSQLDSGYEKIKNESLKNAAE